MIDIDDTGNLYRGEFILDSEKTFIRQGKGIMQYANGSVYEGEWELGVKQGFGRLVNSQGDAYEGGWIDDRAEGFGIMLNSQGYRYEGQWEGDRQEGLGMETWLINNSRYVGNFEDGKKCGHGHY